jgi:malate synthase
LQGAVADDASAAAHLDAARKLFFECAVDPDFPDFLTLPAYEEVLREERANA